MVLQKEKFLEKGKDILKSLINNGCEAYFTGEVVRNKILGIDFNTIEICTSATSEIVRSVFSEYKTELINDGLVKVTCDGFDYYIGTFKQELRNESRKSLQSHYSKSLIDDLHRRDFTINAMAMSHSGKVTDAFNGYEDLQKKKIKTIGKPRIRFNENPIRILKAIRLVSELGFKIDNATYRGMKNNKMLTMLPIKSIVEELKYIITGPYFKKALVYLVDSGVYRRIPVLGPEFKRLSNKYRDENIETILGCAFVQNKGIDDNFAVLSNDLVTLKKVVDLALVTPKSNYDKLLLFNYGQDICQQANYINVLLGTAKRKSRKIKKEYMALPVKKVCDLAFKGEDIIKLTGGLDGPYINEIMDDIIYKILFDELPNDYDTIKIFAISAIKEKGLLTDINKKMKSDSGCNYDKLKGESLNLRNDDLHREDKVTPVINNIERANMDSKYEEYERRLSEKDRKIAELENRDLRNQLENDVKQMMAKNKDLLDNIDSDDLEAREQAKLNMEKMYRDFFIKSNPKYKKLKDANNE